MQQIMAFPPDITVELRECMCFCLKFCFLSGLSWSEYHCMYTELLVLILAMCVMGYTCTIMYCIARNIHLENIYAFFLPPAIMANFLSCNFLSRVNDYII